MGKKKSFITSELDKGEVKCVWCQKVMKRTEITIEHVQPKALGGSNDDSNLKLACRKCNNERGYIMGLVYFAADQLRDHIREKPGKRGRYIKKYAKQIDEQTEAFRIWEERHKAHGLNFVHDPWHHLGKLDPALLNDVMVALKQRRKLPPAPVKVVTFRATWSFKKVWFRFKKKFNIVRKRWGGRWSWFSHMLVKTKTIALQRPFRYCYWCDTQIGLTSAEVDYRIPVSHGGKKADSNCVLSCRTCKHERAKAIDLVTLRPKFVIAYIRSRPSRCISYRNGYKKVLQAEAKLLKRWEERHQARKIPINLDPGPAFQIIESLARTTKNLEKQKQQ